MANTSIYPATTLSQVTLLDLDLDLVLEATGVHREVFLVLIWRPGIPLTTLKYTSAFWGITSSSSSSELLSGPRFGRPG